MTSLIPECAAELLIIELSDKDVDKIDQAGKRQRWGEAAINFVMWAVAFAVFWNIWVIIGALYPDWVPTAERLWD